MTATIRPLLFTLASLRPPAGSPQGKIVGQWEVEGGANPMVLEFSK
jgi:hypothetical protein